LSQKIPSSGWGPGLGNLRQNGQKPTSLMTSPTKKNENQNLNLFHCKLEDSSSLLEFEQLSGTING